LNLITQKLGKCAVCGKRVYKDEDYVKSADGYCCENCLTEEEMVTA
jgi:hypothetical protein